MRPTALSFSVLLALPAFAAAQTPRQAGALHSESKTWTTPYDPKARPRDPYADQTGRVWFVGQEGNFVAYLHPETGEFKQYTIDPGTNPHNLVVHNGMVWYTGNRNGRIVKLDPATGKLTTYLMPDSTVRDPHTMTFDRAGNAWFTAQQAGVVGKLTVADGKIRLWRLERGSKPYGIWLDSHDRPYFDEFGTNKIGTIDPQSLELKEYPLPNSGSRPRRIAVTADDHVWYGDYNRGFLGHLDPKTGAVEEFPLPSGPLSLPYAMTLDDRGVIWVAETGVQPNKLQAFDPRRKSWTEALTIQAEGPNSIRHMTFDKATRQIWFGGDANMIGRVKVAPAAVVP
jgi:virginiamycin B lyase